MGWSGPTSVERERSHLVRRFLRSASSEQLSRIGCWASSASRSAVGLAVNLKTAKGARAGDSADLVGPRRRGDTLPHLAAAPTSLMKCIQKLL